MKIDKLLDYIGWTFLIATIIFLKVAERLLDNIIKAKSFLLEYSTYGLIFSATVLFLIYKLQPEYFRSKETKRGSAVLSYFFGIIALFVFGMAYYNLETAKRNTKTSKALVLSKSKNFSSGTPYLKLDFDDRTERFQPTKKEWEKIVLNDTVILTTGLGQLGYQHILKFSTYSETTTDDKAGSH
jgi:hypothetical protein